MQKNSLKQLMLVVALFTMQTVFGTISAKPISGKVTSATDGEPLIGQPYRCRARNRES